LKALPGLPPMAVFTGYYVLAVVMAEISFRTLERVFLCLR
jgi:hypothetical protein